MSNRIAALFLLFAALCLSEASAQCPAGSDCPKAPGPPSFAEFDLDGDGAISSEEYYQARGARMAERAKEGGKLRNAAGMPTFEDIDLDGNGSLSPDEFMAHHGGRGRHHHGHHH